VYLNATVSPMATFWSRAVSFDSAESALNAFITRPDRAALFVTPAVRPEFAKARPFVISASSVALDTRHARVVIDAPHDGVVMLTQQDAPAWHVFVDGVERKKLLASGIFRAVEVVRGHHEIEWRYRSLSLLIGMYMTTLTSLSLLLSKFVKAIRARNFS
jgi:hypothetical protein